MRMRERLGKYKLQSLPGAKSLIVPEVLIDELDRHVQAQLQKIRSESPPSDVPPSDVRSVSVQVA